MSWSGFTSEWLEERERGSQKPQETRKGSGASDMVYGEIRTQDECWRLYLPVTPVAKPRMTRSDKWKERTCVIQYRQFCDALRKEWGKLVFPPAGVHLVFHMPMPKSWSKKKKAEMVGKPHTQRPDVDNLIKSVLDALHTEDSHIYNIEASKYWADGGYIEVYFKQEFKRAA